MASRSRGIFAGSPLALFWGASVAWASDDSSSAAQSTNRTAILVFAAFVLSTLVMTWWASRRMNSRDAFYTAGGHIPAWHNGLAICGDFISAATFLGSTGLIFAVGYDAYLLNLGIVVGWPIMLMLVSERFRNLGRYTFVDVVTYRLKGDAIRLQAALTSLCVVVLYLIGQMIGAGKLIELLFDLDYAIALLLVTVLIIVYVIWGGMLATTWIQMVKATLLLAGGVYLSAVLLARFGFDIGELLRVSASMHAKGPGSLAPGSWLHTDFFNIVTIALTMCFGVMGLPHVLMRFFTVKDAAAARKSVAFATLLMCGFYLLIVIIGFGAAAVVGGNPAFHDTSGALIGGDNMVALHLAQALGGNLMLGFMSAVIFATILAVVIGLALAGAAAISHDIYAVLFHHGNVSPKDELRVSRFAVLTIGMVALMLSVAFEGQNVAVVTALALSIAASINFPLLILALYWRNLTSRGAWLGGSTALGASIVLIVLSDSVWVAMLGNETAIFPYIYPTIVAMPLCFVLTYIVSMLDRSPQARAERAAFHEQYARSETGAADHAETRPGRA